MKKILGFLTVLCFFAIQTQAGYDKPVNFACPESKYFKFQKKHQLLFITFYYQIIHFLNIRGQEKYILNFFPSDQAVAYISSVHSNRHEDRLFHIFCKRSPLSFGVSHWSGYVNGMDEAFTYYCPPRFVITGKILRR